MRKPMTKTAKRQYQLLALIVCVCILLIWGKKFTTFIQTQQTAENTGLSEAVLAYKPLITEYAKRNGIEAHVNVLLAIMQVESSGTLEDVMQISEAMGLPPNSMGTLESIQNACAHFASLLETAQELGCDFSCVVQAYNFGRNFLNYAAEHGGVYTFELAQAYAAELSEGQTVSYENEISVAANGGWRYDYGNMFYVQMVSLYLK